MTKNKKKSTVKIGKINENKTRDLLIANGFKVHSVELNARYGNQDIFGLHDHSAKHESVDDILILVQTKSNRNAEGKTYKAMAEFNYRYQFVFAWYDDKDMPDIFKSERLIVDNEVIHSKRKVTFEELMKYATGKN